MDVLCGRRPAASRRGRARGARGRSAAVHPVPDAGSDATGQVGQKRGPKSGASCPGRPARWSRSKKTLGEIRVCKTGARMCRECGFCERHCDCADAVDTHKRQRQQPVHDLGLRILPARETATHAAAASAEHLSPVAEQQFTQQLTYTDANIPLTDGNATLENVATRFGFDPAKTSVLLRSGKAGGRQTAHAELNDGEHLRRFNALDSTSKIIAKIIDPEMPDLLLDDWHRYNGQLTTSTEKDQLVDNAVALLEKIGANCESRVVLGALLCKSLRPKTLRALSASRYLHSCKQGKDVFNTIIGGGKIPRQFATVCRVNPPVIKELVGWVLTDENVQLLSWGQRTARTDSGRQQITCVSRKKSKSQLWRDYLRSHPVKKQRVGKTSFMLVVGEITGKQQKSVKAVDYLVSELIHQN
eukprot:COSAG02_NODE_13263_length_1418_cov_1.216831_1_plen_414_part_10